ncbi:MAG: type II toxin-antitoxin system VapC family toxin [bacterium]|nr:type II toxin-antitoxin system VapC family toxin [bacterium]
MPPLEKVYLIDTNVILRYLLNDHKRFSPKAKAFMQDVAEGFKKAELLSVVVVECVYVMEKFYEIPKNEIVDKLSRTLNINGIIHPDKSAILDALLKFENSSADIVDCILAAKSSPQRIVVSFDKDFKRLKASTEKL